MGKTFFSASEIVLSYYKAHEYSYSVIQGYKSAIETFNGYLKKTGIVYSFLLALEWLQKVENSRSHAQYKVLRRAIYLTNDVIEHGQVTTSKFQYPRSPAYQLLNPSYKNDLNEYLENIKNQYTTSSLQGIRIQCASVANWIQCNGAENPEKITHSLLFEYWNSSNWHANLRMKNSYAHYGSRFIEFLEQKYQLERTLYLVLNAFLLPDLIILEKEQEQVRKSFHAIALEKGQLGTFSTYEEAFNIFEKKLQDLGYSHSVMTSVRHTMKSFHVFLDANHLKYSDELFIHWFDNFRDQWGNGKKAQVRRTIYLFSDFLQTGVVTPQHIYRKKKNGYKAPEWVEQLLESFLLERKQSGMSKSTVQLDHLSICRFLKYLEAKGINSFASIAPQHLIDFNLQDIHETPAGQNSYNSRIRGFIRYLGKQNLVKPTLEIAVPSNIAPTQKIVQLLTVQQKEAVLCSIENASTPHELRRVLIVSLGFFMGFRAVDIIHIKLSDINWNSGKISFVQQKTGVPIELPFPVTVGNLLYRYITEARPKQATNSHLIVKHRSPYDTITPNNCREMLNTILSNAGCQDSKGFHVTRRQFATEMLRHNVPPHLIATSLGHSTDNSLDPYLAMDNERMNLCPISLKGITFQGDWYE